MPGVVVRLVVLAQRLDLDADDGLGGELRRRLGVRAVLGGRGEQQRGGDEEHGGEGGEGAHGGAAAWDSWDRPAPPEIRDRGWCGGEWSPVAPPGESARRSAGTTARSRRAGDGMGTFLHACTPNGRLAFALRLTPPRPGGSPRSGASRGSGSGGAAVFSARSFAFFWALIAFSMSLLQLPVGVRAERPRRQQERQHAPPRRRVGPAVDVEVDARERRRLHLDRPAPNERRRQGRPRRLVADHDERLDVVGGPADLVEDGLWGRRRRAPP